MGTKSKKGKEFVIDAHAHVFEDTDPRFAKGIGTPDTLVSAMRKAGVAKSVLLPIAPFVSNEYIGQLCATHPDEFIGFASVDPHQADAECILERDVKRFNLKGVKLHPRLQKFSPSQESIIKIVRKAASMGLPVIFDCFPQRTPDTSFTDQLPERFAELAASVPEAKIIMAHLGGIKLWDAFPILKAHPNIYVDLSFSPHYLQGSSLYQDLAFVMKKLGAGRCIYGSDHPEVLMEDSLALAEDLAKKAGYSKEDRELFFGGTMLSLLPVK